ncbi:heavy-metal-associated domain-containing protein [Methylobacillus arboreus]|uniref:heavy-metal-associated domain-containing protein n=1 Tax=Methylobacillus arboreus TaxID=755170 RepID=UPI002E231B20|nr:heavy-metal-associated domain-containing protein [Methylobacillus arboreus]
MHTFKVNDMSCNHCVQSITKAAFAIDPQAVVNVDLAAKTVSIESSTDAAAFRHAISEAGYTPE